MNLLAERIYISKNTSLIPCHIEQIPCASPVWGQLFCQLRWWHWRFCSVKRNKTKCLYTFIIKILNIWWISTTLYIEIRFIAGLNIPSAQLLTKSHMSVNITSPEFAWRTEEGYSKSDRTTGPQVEILNWNFKTQSRRDNHSTELFGGTLWSTVPLSLNKFHTLSFKMLQFNFSTENTDKTASQRVGIILYIDVDQERLIIPLISTNLKK